MLKACLKRCVFKSFPKAKEAGCNPELFRQSIPVSLTHSLKVEAGLALNRLARAKWAGE